MATQFQIKRTSVSGRTPNTTSSGNSTYIAAGELAINLTDGKLFSSNGSAIIEAGSNLSSLKVTGVVTQGNTTVSGFINAASDIIINSGKLAFKALSGANVYLVQQGDDNLVLYTTSTSGAGRPVWSVFANSNTSSLSIAIPLTLNDTLFSGGGSGTSGQVLTSSGASGAPTWTTVSGSGTATTLNANTTDTQTFYLPMANTTTGSWTNGVVATTKMSFVPSTGVLTVTGVNATSISVGANVSLSTSTLSIGNATVNSVLTSATLRVGSLNANATAVNLTGNLAINGTVGTNGQVVSMNGTSLAYTSLPPTIAIYDTSNNVLANAYFVTGSSIDGLSDVDTSTVAPSNGQTLIWNSANSQWYPGNVVTNTAPTVLNTIAPYFDGARSVFALKTDQTSVSGITDSKDLEVVVNGQWLSPYVNNITYPWITPYDSINGFRVVGANLTIYIAPQIGDTASLVWRPGSSTPQTKKYPFSATTIALGD